MPTIIDMHLHTTRGASDSNLDPEVLAQEAQRRGLTAVNITEHDRLWDRHSLDAFRERHPQLFINNGMEVSTDLGHMIVVGLPAYRAGIHQARELRRALDEVGGFMAVAHPFRHFFDPVYFRRQGKEPFTMTPEEAAERMAVFKLVDGIEVLNGANTPRENLFALKVAQYLGKTMTAGSDAHSHQGIGIYALVFEKAIRSERELLEELHAGRCVPHLGLLEGRLRPFTEHSFEGVSVPNT
ncbi:MAG TPA: CehA/McbA family metallohydrolase [Dehalococcoidia bacterium]|nr:CehA/McbA family metallohydrolase [Dehalococcoidia bacterium]